MTLDTETKPASSRGPGHDERLAHLVLKGSWPVALCEVTVSDFFGAGAPAMDRCHACIKIASDRGLGRPGWASQ
jgi:hypothetical protein